MIEGKKCDKCTVGEVTDGYESWLVEENESIEDLSVGKFDYCPFCGHLIDWEKIEDEA